MEEALKMLHELRVPDVLLVNVEPYGECWLIAFLCGLLASGCRYFIYFIGEMVTRTTIRMDRATQLSWEHAHMLPMCFLGIPLTSHGCYMV